MGPDLNPDEFAALAELSEIFGELVETLHQGQPADLTPQRIVDTALHCVPRSRSCALVIVDDDGLSTVAATDGIGDEIARIRDGTGEGPTLDILETNDLVACDDLPDDERWPEFGRQATDRTGVRSILSYRLYLGRNRRGALSFYSDWPYAFDEVAIATGAIFAAYCSLALISNHLFGERVSRRRSSEVHREIGIAVGILMASLGLDTSAAFARLHGSARQLRKSLPEVSEYVQRHGALPAQES